MASVIRVAVIDGHPLFGVGVALALRHHKGFEIAGCGTSAADAVQIAALQSPDVVLIDAHLPGGISAAQEVARNHPVAKVIMLTASVAELQETWVSRAGAHGWVLKSATGTDLVGAIRNVYRGSLFVSPGLSARIAVENGKFIASTRIDSGLSVLTPREALIILHVCRGLRNKEVANLIGLREPTVKNCMTCKSRSNNPSQKRLICSAAPD